MIYTPLSIPMVLAGLLELAIIVYAFRYKNTPAARPFCVLMAAAAGWAFAYALAISIIDLPLRIFLGIFVVGCCTIIAFAELILAIVYVGKESWLTRQRMVFLSLIPTVVILLDITSPLHTLFRYNFQLDLHANVSALVFSIGPFFILYIIHIILYCFTAIYILCSNAIRRRQDYQNTFLLTLGILFPLIGGMVFIFGYSPIPHFDFGPILLLFTGICMIVSLFGGRLLDVTQVARDQIIDHIQDLVIVLDSGMHIVDMNQAAMKEILVSGKPERGLTPDRLPGAWGENIDKYLKDEHPHTEIVLELDQEERIYEISRSTIIDKRKRQLGYLLLLHNETARKSVDEGLRESEEKFRRMAETTTMGIFILEREKFSFVNPAFSQITGYSVDELFAMNSLTVIHPEDREMVRIRSISRLKGNNEPERYEVRFLTKNDQEIWILMSVSIIPYKGKAASLGTCLDITDRRRLEEDLRASQKLYQDIIEDQTDLVGRWLPDTTVTFVNQAHCKYFGLKHEDYVGKRFIEDLPPGTQKIIRNAIDTLMEGNVDSITTEEINFSPEGEKRWAIWVYHPIRDNQGNIVEFQSVGRDITDRKRMEFALAQVNEELLVRLENIQLLQAQVMEQAIRDALTGLFNRRFMEESLEREVAGADRRNYPIGILMLDLDYFKKLNDTFGHKAGDLVLQSVGQILLTQTRQMDVACRFGGEEFVVIMPTSPLETAADRAENLRKAIEDIKIEYDEKVLRVTCSVGVAAYPLHGEKGETVLRAADDAMYAAKAAGRNRVVIAPQPTGSPDEPE